MTYPHEQISAAELIDRMRRAAWVWFRNDDILLLEELIRRYQQAVKPEEKTNG